MNTRRLMCAALALAASFSVSAQPPGEPGPGRPDAPAPVAFGPPIERYFELLRERDPGDYQRLRALRESDPAAFRSELRDRLQRARERAGPPSREGAPRDVRPGMPERGPDGPPPRGHGRPDDPMIVRTPELDQLEQKSRELARELRFATGAERERLVNDLRSVLAQAFDLRESLRSERLAQMKERLHRIQTLLDERASNRTAIIERRLRDLTQVDSTAW